MGGGSILSAGKREGRGLGCHSLNCEDCVFSTIFCGVELSDMSLESALDSFCFICMPIEPVQPDRSCIEQTKRALRVQN